MSYTHILPGAASLAYHTPTLSKAAKRRLAWFDFYRAHEKNATLTCRHFGISRGLFYKWKKRYNPWHIESLEEKSRRPQNTRRWEVSRAQEFRILSLRRAHIRWGKMKLKRLYEDEYHEPISSWKIQRVIEKHGLYFNPAQNEKLRKKHKANQVKKRITELKKEKRSGFLLALDAIVLYWFGVKRYILTAIDEHGKIAYARLDLFRSNTKFINLKIVETLSHIQNYSNPISNPYIHNRRTEKIISSLYDKLSNIARLFANIRRRYGLLT